MTYDPKAKRPPVEDPADDPAPVDQLLGAPEPSPPAAPRTQVTPPSTRLPEPVPTRRTPKAIAGALVAVAIILLGWRRYRR